MKETALWLGLAGGVVGLALYAGLHLTLSLSPSLPVGLYWKGGAVKPLTIGALVELSPPDALFPLLASLHVAAPGTPLLKRVVALAGDEVCWTGWHMIIWGRERYARQENRILDPRLAGCRVLEPDEVIVVGDHPHSVDSRDVGPVHRGRVLARVIPLWIWGA
jgi:type IV secretory pathway protease TraF